MHRQLSDGSWRALGVNGAGGEGEGSQSEHVLVAPLIGTAAVCWYRDALCIHAGVVLRLLWLDGCVVAAIFDWVCVIVLLVCARLVVA